jgi:cellulose synthase/poly-beta-1,6-N-acetylglucosamine synthase-like glycosyltransferase
MVLTFHEILLYFFCFIGLFVSFFFMLTLFSSEKKRHLPDSNFHPMVTIIIPIWNEGSANAERLKKTVNSLLYCDYPKNKLEIIIVNDGSTDNSLELANNYKKYGVKVFSNKVSCGKTYAVNVGLKHAKGEFISTLDADSFIMPDVIDKLVVCFKDKRVMAAVPSIKIWNPKSFLQKVQFHEFFSAVFIRHIQSEINAVPLAPGAFTLIRKSFLDGYGSLRTDTMVEDLEISMRIQSNNFIIENVIDANVYTSGVKTLKSFINQRIRWFCGFFIQMKNYKFLISKNYGDLGVFVLPMSLFYVFLSIFLFFYTILLIIINTVDWIFTIALVGFNFSRIFEFNLDPFFLTINTVTVVPFILFFVMAVFIYYTKFISDETQGVFLPFLFFNMSYWFLGSLCWVLAFYAYLTHKKIKWGPNYFNS